MKLEKNQLRRTIVAALLVGLLGPAAPALAVDTYPGLAPPGPCAEPRPRATPGPVAGQPVAWVVSLTGTASAQRPGAAPRPLQCGDALYAGERVVTGAASSVAVIFEDAQAPLGVAGDGEAATIDPGAGAIASNAAAAGATCEPNPPQSR